MILGWCEVTFSIFFVSKIPCKVAKIIVHFRWFMIYSFLLFIEYTINRIPYGFRIFWWQRFTKNEFFLSFIVSLHCFLSSRYIWCSFGLLLSRDFIRDSSNFWRSIMMEGSFFMVGSLTMVGSLIYHSVKTSSIKHGIANLITTQSVTVKLIQQDLFY